ncbi:MAG: biotin transporter BioY [Ruminococcus sp.]|nr:biotin transporter BioY [Ruminococcus sp.]MBQ4250788.1 biotin transporter BioY [Ruminococcus sp.]
MANTQPSKAKLTTLAMVQIALCTALICVSAQLAIPLPIGVPFTLQVLMVMLTALILKPLYSVISLLLYVLLGVVGLPVFSGAKSGIGTILSPTGGFIIGFVLAAFLVSLLKGVLGRKLGGKLTVVRYIIVTVIIGIPVMYIPGIALYMVYTGADLVSAIVTLTSVFILLDIAKCVIASLIAVPLNKALAKIY